MKRPYRQLDKSVLNSGQSEGQRFKFLKFQFINALNSTNNMLTITNDDPYASEPPDLEKSVKLLPKTNYINNNCHSLNVCTSLNSCVGMLNPQSDGIRRWGLRNWLGHDGGGCMMGSASSWKGPRELLAPCEAQWELGRPWSRKSSPSTESAGATILGLPPPELWKMSYL